MIPIQDLLNRIRWDKEFGEGSFEVGYYDRILDTIIKVPFCEIRFIPDNHFAFQVIDQNEITISIPFHRCREVYKNGLLIWKRVE
jgi:uncharacterized protein (UPF0248 family)